MHTMSSLPYESKDLFYDEQLIIANKTHTVKIRL